MSNDNHEVTSIPSEARKLSEIVGAGVMTFAPHVYLRHPFDADASGVMFGIDDTVYIVFEDESDGYRSSAGPLLSFKGAHYELGHSFYAEYIREPVLCSHRTSGEYGGEDDVLEIRSIETGKVIFCVGTENVADYYPSYVVRWSPENLSANSKKRLQA